MVDALSSDNPAKAFEAYFFRQMLSSVQLGPAGDANFDAMIREALADKLAESEPLGLAPMLEAEPTASAVRHGHVEAPPRARGMYAPASLLTQLPVMGTVSSPFGPRTDPFSSAARHHGGMDIAAPEGTPVVSAGAGRVTRAEMVSGYGNLVVVDHGGGLETRYAHLATIEVSKGQELAPGGAVGTVGQTGRSTGPHLHFEVRRQGRSLPPESELLGLKDRLK